MDDLPFKESVLAIRNILAGFAADAAQADWVSRYPCYFFSENEDYFMSTEAVRFLSNEIGYSGAGVIDSQKECPKGTP